MQVDVVVAAIVRLVSLYNALHCVCAVFNPGIFWAYALPLPAMLPTSKEKRWKGREGGLLLRETEGRREKERGDGKGGGENSPKTR